MLGTERDRRNIDEPVAFLRLPPNGRRDRSFGESGVWHTDPPGSQGLARAALTQPDGKVVAGGWVQIERFGANGPGTHGDDADPVSLALRQYQALGHPPGQPANLARFGPIAEATLFL